MVLTRSVPLIRPLGSPIYVAQFALAPFNCEESVRTNEAWLTELSVAELRKVIELSPEAVSE